MGALLARVTKAAVVLALLGVLTPAKVVYANISRPVTQAPIITKDNVCVTIAASADRTRSAVVIRFSIWAKPKHNHTTFYRFQIGQNGQVKNVNGNLGGDRKAMNVTVEMPSRNPGAKAIIRNGRIGIAWGAIECDIPPVDLY